MATDADNVFVILSAKTLNPRLTVVTRAAEEDAEQKLRRAGADTVFSPYRIAGHRMAQSLLRPHVVQLLDFTNQAIGPDVTIEQFRVESGVELTSRKLGDLAPREARVIVLAIGKSAGGTTFNPPPGTEVADGDVLIVMGAQADLRGMESVLTKRSDQTV
jgi:voltage-gated potassium channel